MIAYGNDDLWNGATYNISGTTTVSDTWVWANSTAVPEPGSGILVAFAGLSVIARRRR